MKKTIKKCPRVLAIVIVSLISFVPFYYTLTMSTHSTDEIMLGVSAIPGKYLLTNISTALNDTFWVAFKNSLIVSLLSMTGSVLISLMAGYGLVVYQFRLKRVIYNFVLLTMMVPSVLGIIGYMQEMRVLHLSGTLIPLILIWLPSGFGVFWITQYLQNSLQMELVESARIDGCNEFMIFAKIVMPCIKPAIISLCLLLFLWSWNSYLLPLVMINKADNYTIPLYIQSLGNEHKKDIAAQITGLLISIVPLIAAFAIFSKDFIRGLTEGAVKGSRDFWR